jgi:3',5'-nucleoside bisphosphate phosphatase
MIDLHSHTTASDGEHPPAELLRRAHAAGIETLAVSDHDTVAGLKEAETAAAKLGIRLIPGIELTAFLDGTEVHLLGHFIDPANAQLTSLGLTLRKGRHQRMIDMIEKLRAIGVTVDLAEVESCGAGENLRRPHLARALVKGGYAKDVSDAFDKYLSRGRPAYVEHPMLTLQDAIALVRGSGGAATVAHPGVSHLDRAGIAHMKEWGLSGVEVVHSDHKPAEREKWLNVAKDLDLVPTAGSDFHGETVAPGRRLGGVSMDAADLARLESRRG